MNLARLVLKELTENATVELWLPVDQQNCLDVKFFKEEDFPLTCKWMAPGKKQVLGILEYYEDEAYPLQIEWTDEDSSGFDISPLKPIPKIGDKLRLWSHQFNKFYNFIILAADIEDY